MQRFCCSARDEAEWSPSVKFPEIRRIVMSGKEYMVFVDEVQRDQVLVEENISSSLLL